MLPAIDFLPKAFKKSPFFQFLARMIDSVRADAEVDVEQYIHYLVPRLFKDATDLKAAAAYFNTVIEPILGTHMCLENLIKMIAMDARIIEWFETQIYRPFKFMIEVDKPPDDIDIYALIDMVYEIKNERSWLISLRMPPCRDRMVYDYNRWDYTFWSTLEGVPYRRVMICLFKYFYFYFDYMAEIEGDDAQLIPYREYEIGPSMYYIDLTYYSRQLWYVWDKTSWDFVVNYIGFDPKFIVHYETVGTATAIVNDEWSDTAIVPKYDFFDTKAIDSNVWDIVCTDNFIYVATTNGLVLYSIDQEGELTYLTTNADVGAVTSIDKDDRFIYCANYITGIGDEHLSVFKQNRNELILKDSYDIPGYVHPRDIKKYNNYLYVISNNYIYWFTVDNVTGKITYKNRILTNEVLKDFIISNNFIVLIGFYGLQSYEIVGDSLVECDYITVSTGGDPKQALWGDGEYYFVVTRDNGYFSYRLETDGTFTFIDNYTGHTAQQEIVGDDDYLYVGNNTELLLFTKENGVLALDSTITAGAGDSYFYTSYNSTFLILANYDFSNTNNKIYVYNKEEFFSYATYSQNAEDYDEFVIYGWCDGFWNSVINELSSWEIGDEETLLFEPNLVFYAESDPEPILPGGAAIVPRNWTASWDYPPGDTWDNAMVLDCVLYYNEQEDV